MSSQSPSERIGPVTPRRRSQKFVNDNIRPRADSSRTTQPAYQPARHIDPQHSIRPSQTKLQQTSVLRRSAVAQPAPKAPNQSRRKRSWGQIALIGMAAVVLTTGITVSIMSLQTNNKAKDQVAALTKQSSEKGTEGTSDVPSESKPRNVGAYQVAPSLPKYIKIPSLGINARVKPLGVNNKNELLAPNSIYDAGWYNASAKPGDSGVNGAMLIDGHVHGPTQPGVFNKIKNLREGQIIQVQRGDNKVFSYKVAKVQNYDAKNLDMAVALSSIQPGQPGLNLITCAGKYDRKAGYPERTIVFAVLQK